MTDLTQVIIRPKDAYRAGICARGARPWFEDHGLSWSDFVENGISAQILWDTGDGYARRVVTSKLQHESPADG